MAAMFEIAGQVPVPVLADLLEIFHTSAARWSARSAKDWAGYLAGREAVHKELTTQTGKASPPI